MGEPGEQRTPDASSPTAGTTALPGRGAPSPLAPGRVLSDRYEIRRLLGRGGMGEVWHALDLKLRVEVALKALRPDLPLGEDWRERLRSEVRMARAWSWRR